MDRQTFIREYAAESAKVLASLAGLAATIELIGDTIVTSLQHGGKVMAAGNGGSACEAMHLCEELTGRYHKTRRALAGLCLSADASAITCIANDWDYASVFSRQLEAFAKPGDVFVVFTTSGNSENLVRAVAAAKGLGCTTIGLLGRGGGKLKGACDMELVIESIRGSHVQEAQQAVMHLILEQVEEAFTT